MYGRVRDVLAEKGRQVYTIRKSATVCEAVREMNRKGVGALLVMADEHPVGIFTERDVLRRVVDVDRDPELTKVVEVMTPDPLTVPPSMPVEEAMAEMTRRRFRHLPVIEGPDVIGLVSSGDIMRWVMMHMENDLQHVTEYITGKVN